MSSFRYELESLAELEEQARAPLPLGLAASSPRRTFHRDIYLDTPDDSLRKRGIVCRLRVGANDHRTLSVRGSRSVERRESWIESAVHMTQIPAALLEETPATAWLRSVIDPVLLAARTELEVNRLTRMVDPDWLRRPRIELHYDEVTLRNGGMSRSFYQLCGHVRAGREERLERLAHALEKECDLRPLASNPRERAELLMKWSRRGEPDPWDKGSDTVHRIPELTSGESAAAHFLNPELSLLAFQRRVLALAENPATPLQERLRFLSIVSANLDEFFMVRMAGLRAAAHEQAEEQAEDGMTGAERLEKILDRVAEIVKRQTSCYAECRRALSEVGVHILDWDDLDEKERKALRARSHEEILPALTPLAMTLSPGHPMPHLPHLASSLAIVFRLNEGDRPHLAQLELPSDTTRFMRVPRDGFAVVPIEQVIGANLDLLYPNAKPESAHIFRVTRAGDLAFDEQAADDLLEAVAHAVGRRHHNPAIRVEIERSMPRFVRALVLESLRREGGNTEEIGPQVFQEIDGLLDLRSLGELSLTPLSQVTYDPLTPAAPIATDASFFEEIQARDLLFHHPFESFVETVIRFVHEASVDPAVTTIKITLYRVGDSSPIVDALLEAARSGKRVVVFVELKARFDEENNVSWARALERAGANVVYGLVGLKNHSKVTLVVRREDGQLKRYVHVGTGNYNARSGLQYTDLSLFSAREDLTADIAELFNELTGSSSPPRGLTRGALVAPHQLLPAILGHIERETAHARAGRPASIRAKFNGLSDPEVVRALYEAAAAGVEIDLIVRGICTLRPGVSGLSDRIRVVSVVGRFLEHSRIYRFNNGGSPLYFIGSSDLRPRNLRRRVELLVPVLDSVNRELLDDLLDLYLGDSKGWDLDATGEYTSRGSGSSEAQEQLVQRKASSARLQTPLHMANPIGSA
ncbi:MAG: polyphosphate kinase 1 [Gemmatimonadota bacterium]|nr:polyphosphate kinase 1 [Gemmatimonadota bacterium]